MIYLAPLFLIVISYFFGELFCFIIRDEKSNIAEKTIIGTILMLLSFEGFSLVTIKMVSSFKFTCFLYSIFLLLVVLLAIIVTHKKIFDSIRIRNLIDVKPIIAVVIIFMLQVFAFFILMPDTSLDYTLETVNTTIASDLIYENHPGLGDTFKYGITFRGKIVALPIFYAYLKTLFNGNTACFIYRAIPIWSLILNMLCYGVWAGHLFIKTANYKYKISVFLLGLGALNLCGMFSQNCIFYNQMFRGFRGGTICFSFLLPYCIYCLFSMANTKKNNKWIYIFLALICSLTLTDYEKGFIPIVLSVFLGIAAYHVNKLGRWIQRR